MEAKKHEINQNLSRISSKQESLLLRLSTPLFIAALVSFTWLIYTVFCENDNKLAQLFEPLVTTLVTGFTFFSSLSERKSRFSFFYVLSERYNATLTIQNYSKKNLNPKFSIFDSKGLVSEKELEQIPARTMKVYKFAELHAEGNFVGKFAGEIKVDVPPSEIDMELMEVNLESGEVRRNEYKSNDQ